MIEKTSNWNDPRFDTIIDVRAPSEFANDHIIGAINCPVLNNNERDEVGYLYKNVSGFKARVIGSSMTARNIASHIENNFSQFDGGWRPLVYCWRGGQRSRSMSIVLREVGWRVAVLEGGHKRYRKDVIKMLPETVKKLKVVLVSGQTGSGKTQLLSEISSLGGQVLDLENIANHRGSLLGGFPENSQPSQKFFESLLLNQLTKYNEKEIVFIESESSKIGQLHIPSGLWNAMASASYVELNAPAKARAQFLVSDYADLKKDKSRFKTFFSRASLRVGSKKIKQWLSLLEEEKWSDLALSLIDDYYDPAYILNRSQKRNRHRLACFDYEEITKKSLKNLAQKLLKASNNFCFTKNNTNG